MGLIISNISKHKVAFHSFFYAKYAQILLFIIKKMSQANQRY